MSNKNTSEEKAPMPEANYTDWARQMVESLVEAERKWLEMAAQQNEVAFKALREGIESYRTAPTPTLAEWAKQGLENFLEAQRKWTESASQQRLQFFQTVSQPNAEGATDAAQATTQPIIDYAQKQVEMVAEARRRWLDTAAEQNAQVVKGVKKGLGLEEGSSGATYVDWAQQAVDNYVAVQKRWLDMATQFPFQWPTRRGN